MSVVDRRVLLAALGLGVGLIGAAPSVWAQASAAAPDPFLDRLCDLTIPDTETPGARAAGVPAFLTLAVAHGLDHAAPDTLVRFEAALDAQARTLGAAGFVAAPPASQIAMLERVDARVFGRPAPGSAPEALGDLALWAKVKGFILAGYYTSEVGGSKELAYELVPGRWDADIALKPHARAYSSDWTALEFG